MVLAGGLLLTGTVACADEREPSGASPSTLVDIGPPWTVTGDDAAPLPTAVPPAPTGQSIVWQTQVQCGDNLVASDRIVVANCDGSVAAFGRRDGWVLWAQDSNDDAEDVPGITDDDTVVYVPTYGAQYAMAFDGRTGRSVPVPKHGVHEWPAPMAGSGTTDLPPGYAYGADGLTYRGTLIWPGGEGGDPEGPFVHRQDGVTVINDWSGLQVVADDGEVLLAPPLRTDTDAGGVPSYVWDIGHHQIAAVANDGILYVIDLRSNPSGGTGADPKA